jgi:hypothetical protein
MYKKISYLLTVALALGFAACSDQNEVVQKIYDEVAETPIVRHIEYTLTDADYGTISAAAETAAGDDAAKKALAKAVKSTKSLNSFAPSADYVPAIIAKTFTILKEGSTVQVTSNYSEDIPEYLGTLAGAGTYTLKAADYASVWGEDTGVTYLTPANSPKAKLPAILAAAHPEAASGDVVIATYKYSDQEPNLAPSEISGEVSEDFESYAVNDEVNQNGWSQVDVTGTHKWLVKVYNNNKFAEVSSYNAPKEESNVYLVMPQVDLAKNVNPVFAFDIEVRYPVAGQDYLRVLIAEDYKSDPATATWVDVTDKFTLPTAGGSLAPAGSFSLLDYAGKMIHIAFKYQGDGNAGLTTTLRIDNPRVLDASKATEIFGETFEGKGYANYDTWEGNGWTQIVTEGTKNWQVRSYSNNFYGQMSANSGADEVSESYAISPEIDLTTSVNTVLSFSATVGYWNYKSLSVLVTEDAAALTSPATVEWNDVTAGFLLPEEPASGYGTLSPVGAVSLKQYDGKKIYVAFKYYGEKGTGNTWTSTYQVDNISVGSLVKSASKAVAAKTAPIATRAVISAPVDQKAIYTYNGSAWAPYEGALVLNPADYTAMGSTNGSLTSAQAATYLPEYLARNVEYAAKGDKVAVVYSGSSSTVADEYAYTGEEWAPTNVPVVRTEQFVYSTAGWIFDPTVTFTMVTADYQLVIDYMKADSELVKFVNTQYNNEEFYFGFSSRYTNVSFRFSYRDDTNYDSGKLSANDTELHALDGDNEARAALLWERLEQKGMPLLLAAKYPDAPLQVLGVDMHYKVGVAIYYPDGVTNTTVYYVMTYKVATAGSAGTPPTFTFVEAKEVAQAELP